MLQSGELKFIDPRQVGQIIRRLPPGEYDVRIEKHVKRRSLKANAYLWGVVYRELSEWTGYHPDELHELFKAKFLQPAITPIVLADERGEVIVDGAIQVATTTTLKTDEFAEFVERIRQLAAELGCVIPAADPEYMFK